MISVVRRTGHSSYYVEKGMNALGKTQKQLGIPPDLKISGGGKHARYGVRTVEHSNVPFTAFPIWLEVRTNTTLPRYSSG